MRIFTTITPVYTELVQIWLLDSIRLTEPELHVHVEMFDEIHSNGDFGTQEFKNHNRRKAEKIAGWCREHDNEILLVCDADVIFLKPFKARLQAELADYDMAISPETLSGDGYNIGQVLIRGSEKVARFYESIAASLDEETWDQELINAKLPSSGLRHKSLSPFFSNTLIWRDMGPRSREQLFSYHATETYPSGGKSSIELKKEFMAEVRACGLNGGQKHATFTQSFRASS
jgi:hypothetical protein